ncbi:MAG: histidinol dehydrogenase [Nannocystaceae bacterium]
MTDPSSLLSILDLRGENLDARASWRRHCGRSFGLDGRADEVAREIVEDVHARGDAAVFDWTQRLESRTLDAQCVEIPATAWDDAHARLAPTVIAALEHAEARIRAFHESQRPETTGTERPGERLSSRVSPLRRVAVYAPGGTAAYPSSVLMTAVPASVAGVAEIVLLTPRPSDVVLAAAKIAGVHRVFQIGGAQAIAAVAFGTSTIPRVDKIVGPGNAYVTAAKRLVYGRCDIDSIAGPSEILIVADATADPVVVAADLLSQAEHDRQASAVLVTDAPSLVPAVSEALVAQLEDLPRREIAEASLRDQGAAVVVADRAAMIEAANDYAPEHLELLLERAEEAVPHLHTAGAIFVGAFTPEAAGDYTAGPSHVLPTAGAARFSSPLGVWDFVKYTSVLQLEESALREQAQSVTTLARAEGLEAHARAVEIRISKEKAR